MNMTGQRFSGFLKADRTTLAGSGLLVEFRTHHQDDIAYFQEHQDEFILLFLLIFTYFYCILL